MDASQMWTYITGKIGAPFKWFSGFLDGTRPQQSMKALLMFMAGFTLCRGTIMICKAIAHVIYQGQQVDPGAVYALGTLAVPVAGLAGIIFIFRKDGPSQTESSETTTQSSITKTITDPSPKPD